MTIAQVLARAARLVERGWCQHALAKNQFDQDVVNVYEGNPVKFCTIGAIARLSAGSAESDAIDFLERFLRLARCSGADEWNDAPSRTGPEVATWLSSCAQYAKVLGK